MPTHMSAHIFMPMSAHIFIACTCVHHRSLLPSLFAKHSYGYIVMAYIVMTYIVLAYIVMAYIVMAYIVMALYSYGPI